MMQVGLMSGLHTREPVPRLYGCFASMSGALLIRVSATPYRSESRVQGLSAFQRFLRLCAGRTGQLLNLSNLPQDAGIAQTTARAWLSVLEAS
jgi:hypothetical protein